MGMDATRTLGKAAKAQSQAIAYTGTAGTSAALPPSCSCVRLVSTTDCFVEITIAGTAAVANTGMYLCAYIPEYFSAMPSSFVSAIQVASAGTIYITPME